MESLEASNALANIFLLRDLGVFIELLWSSSQISTSLKICQQCSNPKSKPLGCFNWYKWNNYKWDLHHFSHTCWEPSHLGRSHETWTCRAWCSPTSSPKFLPSFSLLFEAIVNSTSRGPSPKNASVFCWVLVIGCCEFTSYERQRNVFFAPMKYCPLVRRICAWAYDVVYGLATMVADVIIWGAIRVEASIVDQVHLTTY